MKATKKNTATTNTNDLQALIQAEIAKAIAGMNKGPSASEVVDYVTSHKSLAGKETKASAKKVVKLPTIKANADMPVRVKHSEYKGHNLIALSRKAFDDKNHGFSFGIEKAKMILESIDAIKAFVEANHE